MEEHTVWTWNTKSVSSHLKTALFQKASEVYAELNEEQMVEEIYSSITSYSNNY